MTPPHISIYSFWPWFEQDVNLLKDISLYFIWGAFSLVNWLIASAIPISTAKTVDLLFKWNILYVCACVYVIFNNRTSRNILRLCKYHTSFYIQNVFTEKKPLNKTQFKLDIFESLIKDWPRSIKSIAIDLLYLKSNFPLNFHSSMSLNRVWEGETERERVRYKITLFSSLKRKTNWFCHTKLTFKVYLEYVGMRKKY